MERSGAVAFAGDWHGNTRWARHCLRAIGEQKIDTVFHLGDFGLWPGEEGENYLRELHAECEKAGIRIFITLGNHEDYSRVASMPTDEEGWLFLEPYPLFRFAPRGHVWRHGDVLFASLGGAGSVDYSLRTPGSSWWPEEAITPQDVEALKNGLSAAGGGRVDVFLSHDAPAGLHRQGMLPRPSWITPEVEHYTWQGRVLLADAVELAKPRALLHGHWHEWHDDALEVGGDEMKVWGLPEDGNWRNCISALPVAGVGITEVKFALVQ